MKTEQFERACRVQSELRELAWHKQRLTEIDVITALQLEHMNRKLDVCPVALAETFRDAVLKNIDERTAALTAEMEAL